MHGDIKLDNILCHVHSGKKIDIMLSDFGHSEKLEESGITERIRGTHKYIPPNLEKMFNHNLSNSFPKYRIQYNGFKFDIYALAVTIYYILTLHDMVEILFLADRNKRKNFWDKNEE